MPKWLKPLDGDAWLLLVPLYLAQRKPEEAASAAFGALVADSKRLEAHLAVAATLCHLGVVGLGDSIFRATIPRLPEGLRARFEAAGRAWAARFTWPDCARRSLDALLGVCGGG